MRKSQLVLLQGALFIAAMTPATAATIITDLYFNNPIANTAGAHRASFQWSTPLTTGPVLTANVTNLAMRLYQGSTLLYTDVAIAGGVIQPLGGITRTNSDIYFNYNLNTMTLHEFGNLQSTNPAGATGTQYYLSDNVSFPADSMVGIQAITNGVRQTLTIYTLASQTSSTVPEPATNAIVGISLAALAWSRRRARA
jgi:energy-converting hydrogenase Eha subunit A